MAKKILLLVFILAGPALHAETLDVIVMIDTSSSMEPYFDSLLDYLFTNTLDNYLQPGDRFHLLCFSSRPTIEIRETLRGEETARTIRHRISGLKGRLLFGKYTDLLSALKLLLEYSESLQDIDNKRILLLSDGIHDPPPDSPYAGISIAKARSEVQRYVHEIIDKNGWSIRILQMPREGIPGTGAIPDQNSPGSALPAATGFPSGPGATSEAGFPSGPGATSEAGFPSGPGATSEADFPSGPGATSEAVFSSGPGATSEAGFPSGPGATSEAGNLLEGIPGTDGAIVPEASPGTEGAIGPETSPGTEGTIVPETSPGTEGAIVPETSPGTDGAIVPETSPGNDGATDPETSPGNEGAIVPEASPGTDGATGHEASPGTEGISIPEASPGTEGAIVPGATPGTDDKTPKADMTGGSSTGGTQQTPGREAGSTHSPQNPAVPGSFSTPHPAPSTEDTGPREGENLFNQLPGDTDIRIIDFSDTGSGDLPNAAIGFPKLFFPDPLGEKGQRFSVPFKIQNFLDQELELRLDRIEDSERYILTGRVHTITIPPRSMGDFHVPIRLPDYLEYGPCELELELFFLDDNRISPRRGTISFTYLPPLTTRISRAVSAHLGLILILLAGVVLAVLLGLLIYKQLSVTNFSSYVNPKKGHFPFKNSKNLVEMRVSMQNPHIGYRNIHKLDEGTSFTVGGGRSDFLIFLIAIPAGIGEIARKGGRYFFTPRKRDFFPGLQEALPDCLNKPIRVVSSKGFELTLTFIPYISPLEELNKLLNSIQREEET